MRLKCIVLLHDRVKTDQIVKSREIMNINLIPTSTNFKLGSHTPNVNQRQSSFVWLKWTFITVIVILGLYIVIKIPKNESYQSYFERTRKRSAG